MYSICKLHFRPLVREDKMTELKIWLQVYSIIAKYLFPIKEKTKRSKKQALILFTLFSITAILLHNTTKLPRLLTASDYRPMWYCTWVPAQRLGVQSAQGNSFLETSQKIVLRNRNRSIGKESGINEYSDATQTQLSKKPLYIDITIRTKFRELNID